MMSAHRLKRLASLRGGILKFYNPSHTVCSPVIRNYSQRKSNSELSSAMQTINRLFGGIQRLGMMKFPRILSRPSKPSRKMKNVQIDEDRCTYRIEADMPCMDLGDIEFRLKDHELLIHGKVEVHPDSIIRLSLSNGVFTTVAVLPDPEAKKKKKPNSSTIELAINYIFALPGELIPDSIKYSLADGIFTIEGSYLDPEDDE